MWALLLIGCSTPTTVTAAWRDPAYSQGPMRKILVIAQTPVETTRHDLEDTMAASLEKRGTAALASYRVFQAPPEQDAMQHYLDSEHYDGALVVKFQGTRTQSSVQASPRYDNYYGTRFNGVVGGYYSNGYDYTVYTDHYVNVDTALWTAHTDKVAWSVSTQTINPLSSSDAVHSLVDKLVDTMAKNHLVR